MKDIDIGKEYIIPSPGYRSVRERANSVQCEEQEGSKFQHAKHQVSLFFLLFVLQSYYYITCSSSLFAVPALYRFTALKVNNEYSLLCERGHSKGYCRYLSNKSEHFLNIFHF